MNSIRTLLLCLFFTTLGPLHAQETDTVLPDSSGVEVRQMDTEVLTTLKADPDLDYGRSPSAINLWERFKRWLNSLINSLIGAAVSVVALIYVILRLMKVNVNMFYTGKQAATPHGVLDEDIHAMDFDKLIQEALQRNEYRLAIRLLFLKSLKLLADKHHILWQPGKTNHDYLNELSTQHLKTGFNELNFYFEYAWYGNFTINETLYKKVDALYNNWKTNV
jgi:hypothetical protein